MGQTIFQLIPILNLKPKKKKPGYSPCAKHIEIGNQTKARCIKILDEMHKKKKSKFPHLSMGGIFFLLPPINQYEVFFLLESGSKTIFYPLLY